MNKTRCGYVAIVGRPNVGKSTLLNCILKQKISITSSKPQTTRTQILGISTHGNIQAVYIDTPGIHQFEKNAMNRYMNRLANAVITDADVIVFMIEALQWLPEDELVFSKLKNLKLPVILVINKVDAVKDKNKLLPFIQTISEKFSFQAVVPLSAFDSENVNSLENVIYDLLPEGPHLYPADQLTDKNIQFQAAEIIREKILKLTEQEVPYSVTVEIEDFKKTEKLTEISAIIWVEREGQKPIIIGKNGERLKRIGSTARKDLEVILQDKVFLRLWVKVKESWTNDAAIMKQFGFS